MKRTRSTATGIVVHGDVDGTVILEHEVIEQIEDQTTGRPIEWVRQHLATLGAGEPFLILREMWRAGYLKVVDDQGQELKPWQCEEIWRGRSNADHARLIATSLGSEWIHGR